MKEPVKWVRVIYWIGIIALIIGAIDPLEGSILIVAGSVLLALSAQFLQDRHKNIFFVSFLMVLFGVFFLFYFSSLGGFGGSSSLSWWWGLLILPYPIGWLLIVITLMMRAIKKPKLAS